MGIAGKTCQRINLRHFMRDRSVPGIRSLKKRVIRLASVILACLLGAWVLWDPFDIDERPHVQRITALSVRSVQADLAGDMESRILAQSRLATFSAGTEALSEQQWDLAAKLFLEHHPCHVAVQWVDASCRVLRVVTRDGWPGKTQPDCSTDPQLKPVLAAASKHANSEAVIMPVSHLPDGKVVSKVVTPVYQGGVFAGLLIGVMDTKSALGNILADHSGLGYSIAVLEGTRELYRTPGTSREYENKWAIPADVQLPGVVWRIRVWPNPDLLTNIRSKMPEVAFVLGCLLVFMLLLTHRYWRAAQRRSRELSHAHDELDVRVRQRTIELQDSNENLKAEIAERARAEESLRNLSGRLLQLQDEERRRIARELHDSTAQMLGAVAINVDRAQQMLQNGDHARLRGVIGESAELLEGIRQEIGTVSYLLHPPMLDELGLEYVLPWYAEGFSNRSGIAVSLNIQPDFGRVPQELELTLFRIVQEALTNVHRHSGSRTAEIVLFRDSDYATLEISDQGCGIPMGVLKPTKGTMCQLGVGVAGMRERVHQLSGLIDITGTSHGTVIRAVLPLTPLLTKLTAGKTAADYKVQLELDQRI